MESSYNIFPAKWWETTESNKIICTLCPRYCKLSEGQHGFCYVRKNIEGELYSLAYNHPTGFAIDPIEKKPLFHFFPGSEILSFGTAGCNLGCKFCQNWTMSKAQIDKINSLTATPEEVISLALKHKSTSIAFTYNDPVIFGEYVVDISRLAQSEGIKTVMVTAGYIDKNARKDVFKYIDAANVDLKAFSEHFYSKLTSSHLQDILDTLIWLKKETNIWIELTTLLIPDENDSEDELRLMSEWILKNLGDTVPVHFTAFHPSFLMNNKNATPPSTIQKARNIALSAGIKHCYTGNIVDNEGQTTICPSCKTILIKRNWHSVIENKILNGKCPKCQHEIAGRF